MKLYESKTRKFLASEFYSSCFCSWRSFNIAQMKLLSSSLTSEAVEVLNPQVTSLDTDPGRDSWSGYTFCHLSDESRTPPGCHPGLMKRRPTRPLSPERDPDPGQNYL